MDFGFMTGWGETALNLGLIVVLIIVASGLLGFVAYAIMQYKRYTQYKVRIWERDGFGQMCETSDTAGMFVDRKTNNRLLFCRKNKIAMDPNNIPFIPQGRNKVIMLLKVGMKNFRFIKPVISDQDVTYEIGDPDVNTALNEYDRQVKLLNDNTLLMWMPYIAIVFTSVMILVIFVYFFKNFENLKAFGTSMVEIAKIQAGVIQ